MQDFIGEKLRSGWYASAEDAGLDAVRKRKSVGDFHPGEPDASLAKGEQSIAQQGTLDAESSFAKRNIDHDPR